MSEAILKTAYKAASGRKATRVVCFDIKTKSDVCDYQLVCSADNEKQAQAIADAIEELCKKDLGISPAAIEGRSSGQWIAMDYGAVIIHIFLNQIRDFYALESLWPTSNINLES